LTILRKNKVRIGINDLPQERPFSFAFDLTSLPAPG